jgi:asparagine synthase (glutamine-hydrolysing)
MMKQNYEIGCLISMKSKNPDSYMFHTPNINLVPLQAKAMGIPLVEGETEGEKEAELEDLKKAIEKAKKEYRIAGVVTGAIESSYQRERVEKACDDLGLKTFSPLWHIDAEAYMRNLVNDGFEIIISSIAADGLDKSWLGRVLTHEDIDKLIEINKKTKIHIAFEGGEAETLMLDGPLFKNKKLKIEKAEVKMENKMTGKYVIEKARLVSKKSSFN